MNGSEIRIQKSNSYFVVSLFHVYKQFLPFYDEIHTYGCWTSSIWIRFHKERFRNMISISILILISINKEFHEKKNFVLLLSFNMNWSICDTYSPKVCFVHALPDEYQFVCSEYSETDRIKNWIEKLSTKLRAAPHIYFTLLLNK